MSAQQLRVPGTEPSRGKKGSILNWAERLNKAAGESVREMRDTADELDSRGLVLRAKRLRASAQQLDDAISSDYRPSR